MSIRTYQKDHLKQHAGVVLASPERVEAPHSDDALVFWTQHEVEPREVDLHIFAKGHEGARRPQGGGRTSKPFTARPELILQLAPAIKEVLLYAAKKTVTGYLTALREWWCIADAVEASAQKSGHATTRLEDVRNITNIHADFALRSGMSRQVFGKFRLLVDMTCTALGHRQTYWKSPERSTSQKHLPSMEQRKELRFAIKRHCRAVLKRWDLSETFSRQTDEPDDPQEVDLYRHVKYMREIQKKTGTVSPTMNDLCDGFERSTLWKRGISIRRLRESVFPSHRDAHAVWHLCLANTGWNPSTLSSLDVTKNFLIDHFKDNPTVLNRRYVLSPATYHLVGEKERASGNEQVVIGLWKTQDGPGHLIKTYMQRVAPLRELLKQKLVEEKIRYEKMGHDEAPYKDLTAQYERVKELEQGVRSVWLFVSRSGSISWISNELQMSGFVNGRQTLYMDEVVHMLNAQRTAINSERASKQETSFEPLEPLPKVKPSEFRVWFADFVYLTSWGNILHVKKALGHSLLRTSTGYLNTNIINQQSSDSARRFLNILVGELDSGRVDLTILAHLYRHGEVTPAQEELLASARTLPKSRLHVGCKDNRRPPPHIKATSGETCDVQRCLLCVENAVLLPESMDGIAMRVEELRAIQGFLPIETWVEERYDIELKNNLMALRKFDFNQGLAARKKWAHAIACGEHYVPGVPLSSQYHLMDLL